MAKLADGDRLHGVRLIPNVLPSRFQLVGRLTFNQSTLHFQMLVPFEAAAVCRPALDALGLSRAV